MRKRIISSKYKFTAALLLAVALLALAGCYRGHGLEPEAIDNDMAGVAGMITFAGVIPDSTREIRLAALKNRPEGITETQALLNFMINAYISGNLVFSDPLTLSGDTLSYSLDLSPGTWSWLVVAWFPDSDDYLAGVKELGAYTGTADETAEPRPLVISPGLRLTGIDITADFRHIANDTPFFVTRRAE